MVGKILLVLYVLSIVVSLNNFAAACQRTARMIDKRKLKRPQRTFWENVVAKARLVAIVSFYSMIPVFNILISQKSMESDIISEALDKAEEELY